MVGVFDSHDPQIIPSQLEIFEIPARPFHHLR